MSDRTPEEIEREIETERNALTRSLDALQRELSPDVLIDKATAKIREHGGATAENALRQARQNPMAMAVTGLGLAWLAAGPAKPRRRPLRLPPPNTDARLAATPRRDAHLEYGVAGSGSDQAAGRQPVSPRPNPAYDHRTYDRAHGFRETGDPMAGFDERLARASGDTPGTTSTDPTYKQRFNDAMASAKERLMALRARLSEGGHDSKSTARELRRYISEGTEQMSDATRERVIAARQAALDAEQRLEAYARDSAAAGREFYRNQPLIGGLVAFGLGAAIGAALPRTRQEDRYIGSYRDRAMDEAERYYRSEAERLRGVAEDAIDDAKRMASETLHNVAAEAKGEDPKDDSSKSSTSGDSSRSGTTGGKSGGTTGGTSSGTTGGMTGSGTPGGTTATAATGGTTGSGISGGATTSVGSTGGTTASRATGGTTASGATGTTVGSGTTGGTSGTTGGATPSGTVGGTKTSGTTGDTSKPGASGDSLKSGEKGFKTP